MRKRLAFTLLVLAAVLVGGDTLVHAATCTPLEQGPCHACKNCKYCGHCAKQGGKCSVCK